MLHGRSPGGAKGTAHTYSNLLYHAIFSTKGRCPTISPEIRDDLLAYIGGIVRHLGGKTLIAGGTADHVHLLLELPSHVAVADTLRVVKTNSSRWAHERWPERRLFGWQMGYAAFTVSRSNLDAVRAYILNQEQHHKKVDFRDEFRAFLRKNGITCDETMFGINTCTATRSADKAGPEPRSGISM